MSGAAKKIKKMSKEKLLEWLELGRPSSFQMRMMEMCGECIAKMKKEFEVARPDAGLCERSVLLRWHPAHRDGPGSFTITIDCKPCPKLKKCQRLESQMTRRLVDEERMINLGTMESPEETSKRLIRIRGKGKTDG